MARDQHGTTEGSSAAPGQQPEPPTGVIKGTPDTEQRPQPTAPPTTPPTASQPAAGATHDLKIGRTRLSGTWVAVVGFAVILLLLLIFILQNGQTVRVSYLGAHGTLPLGVGLLCAAVAGILLVALAGSARILQLRATARRHRHADAKAAKARP